ncbi:MAG: hypothetical protein R2798_05695 [Chitinophagales bacterium]|nr:hypothetical protein [Bacteroidota bacterium]MCB9042589.1 hypothetical protein [Chitinophagales bacterium]
MLKSTLIRQISCLDKSQFNRFVAFVQSPYHNKHLKVQQLIQLLDHSFPNFHEKNVARQFLYKKLYPKEAYNETNLKLIFSYTLQLFEKFLMIERFDKKDFPADLYLLESLREFRQGVRFNNRYRYAMQKLTENPLKNSDYFYQLIQYTNQADIQNASLEHYQKTTFLTNKDKYLNAFYFIEKLKNLCEIKNRQRFMDMEYQHTWNAHLLDFLQNQPEEYAENPAITIYLKVYNTIEDAENTQHYYELIQLLEQHKDIFPPEELRDIYYYAQNYCIRQINKGNNIFLREVFNLFQHLLSSRIIFENNILFEWHYKNIASIALKLKEFDWVKKFIEDYYPSLPQESQHNAYNFNMATYYYMVLDYNKALDFLNSVEYTDVVYRLDATTLAIIIYYDTQQDALLLSAVDAFIQYLKRNKLIAQSKFNRYYDFARLVKTTHRIKSQKGLVANEKTQRSLEKLKLKLSNTPSVVKSNWLKEKINVL